MVVDNYVVQALNYVLEDVLVPSLSNVDIHPIYKGF